METLVILAAAVATLLACIFVATLSKGARRPPLRLPIEEEWADDAEAVSQALTPPQASPIDRGAQVLEPRAREGYLIEHDVSEAGRARTGKARAVDLPSFDAEELDQHMLDHLLEQQNRELTQPERHEASQDSETGKRTDRRAAR